MTVTFTCSDCKTSVARSYMQVRGVPENALADFRHRLQDQGWHIPDTQRVTRCPRCQSVQLAAEKRDREAPHPDDIESWYKD